MKLARYAAPDTVFETRVGGRGGEPVSHGVSSHLELSNKKKHVWLTLYDTIPRASFLCLRNEMPVIPLNLQFIVLYMFGT